MVFCTRSRSPQHGGVQILKKKEEDCEAKRKEWTKHGQCDERQVWENEELRKLEEALPREKRVSIGESVENEQSKNRSGM